MIIIFRLKNFTFKSILPKFKPMFKPQYKRNDLFYKGFVIIEKVLFFNQFEGQSIKF